MVVVALRTLLPFLRYIPLVASYDSRGKKRVTTVFNNNKAERILTTSNHICTCWQHRAFRVRRCTKIDASATSAACRCDVSIGLPRGGKIWRLWPEDGMTPQCTFGCDFE
ncbi:jg17989 [Pararge aegeria aegeria]|uniref:Jg17989 protein n=1 Tax=Pararge aegeria aegeria TaxID=348720 RepID=A0A8S4S3Q7_9NEOP|nr:jg17989 [Pararge aegeria aegeria]